MLNLFHKKYEFNFPYGQEGFELLYKFLLQPITKDKVWFPQYSGKLWYGRINETNTSFDINTRKQNISDCKINHEKIEQRIFVETKISNPFLAVFFLWITTFLISMYFSSLMTWFKVTFLGIFSIISFILFIVDRKQKIKSIKYNIKMVEHYLSLDKKNSD